LTSGHLRYSTLCVAAGDRLPLDPVRESGLWRLRLRLCEINSFDIQVYVAVISPRFPVRLQDGNGPRRESFHHLQFPPGGFLVCTRGGATPAPARRPLLLPRSIVERARPVILRPSQDRCDPRPAPRPFAKRRRARSSRRAPTTSHRKSNRASSIMRLAYADSPKTGIPSRRC
jgi:hypothetical protein